MTKAINLTVTIDRHQPVTYRGKSLGNVKWENDTLIVNRKPLRSGRFSTFYYPKQFVIASQEGDGGESGSAFATVFDRVTLVSITGKGVATDGEIRIIDSEGKTSVVQSTPNNGCFVSIVENAVEEPPARKPRR
jgi:hypothetical protein